MEASISRTGYKCPPFHLRQFQSAAGFPLNSFCVFFKSYPGIKEVTFNLGSEKESWSVIVTQLHPHQRDGVGRLLAMEDRDNAAFLGDMPGIGKQLQTVALILARPTPPLQPTLVIAPANLMQQWIKDFNERVGPKTNTYIYHLDNRRKVTAEQLKCYEVVITSYETIEAEGRNLADCLHDFDLRMRSFSQKVVDGKGTEKKQYKPLMDKHPDCLLCSIKRGRVVCEEAGRIKSRNSSTTDACTKIQSESKLLITGSPFQNKIEELWSYFTVLGIEPLNDNFVFRRFFKLPTQNNKKEGKPELGLRCKAVTCRH